jgi:hypothetical protein
MKIDNYSLFVFSFVITSLSLLTGFEKVDVNNLLTSDKQAISIKVDQARKKDNKVDLKITRSKNKPSTLHIEEDADLPKPLILSIPFKDSENVDTKAEHNSTISESLNIFSAAKNKKPGALILDGQMLMSQEPEMDKRKSLDGAGIILNLKR